MKVGILGSGVVGQTLAAGFASRDHEVRIGTRSPEKLETWLKKQKPSIRASSFTEAAEFAEVAILATLWTGTENAIRLAGPANLVGKVVIDATNPLEFHPDGPPTLALGHTDSGGEQVQRWLSRSRVVKAFNIVGHGHMVDPQFPGGPPDMFICGNDADAKTQVVRILEAFGWPSPIDIGGIEGSRLLEPLCILWVEYGLRTGTWDHAFKLLRK